MGDTNGWTEPHCRTMHLAKNNLQYTITDYKNFATGFIYDWRQYKPLREDLYFKTVESAKQWMEACSNGLQHYTAEDDRSKIVFTDEEGFEI